MSPVRDAQLAVRATTDGVLDYNAGAGEEWPTGALDISGTPLKGLALRVIIPSTIVDTPMLQVNVHGSTSSIAATTDVIVGSRSGMLAGAKYIVPFSTRCRSVIFDFLVTGSTSATFSIVIADLVLGVGQDWTRVTEFH